MASRRRSFQAPEGPPPQAIQLVHDMIQSFNGYDPWDPEQQDILNYRSANCLHEFIPSKPPSGPYIDLPPAFGKRNSVFQSA